MQFIGIYLLSQLCNIISKNDCGLYRDDGLMIQEYINDQQINQLHKKIIKLFKEIGFKIDIETNSKIVDFLDVTFSMINGSYKPYKKPLLYINKNTNHPPEIIKKLPKTVNNRFHRNALNAEIFNASKVECKAALKNGWYKNVVFNYNVVNKNNSRQNTTGYPMV